jgi:hypothetical protein
MAKHPKFSKKDVCYEAEYSTDAAGTKRFHAFRAAKTHRKLQENRIKKTRKACFPRFKFDPLSGLASV